MGAGTSGQHLDTAALLWASQPISACRPPQLWTTGVPLHPTCPLQVWKPLPPLLLPSANLFANRHSKLFPRLHNPQSPGQQPHLIRRGGWGCRLQGPGMQGSRLQGVGWEDWDERAGMWGLGCRMQGCEDRDARIGDIGCRDRDVGCGDQDAGYPYPAPYRAMKVGPSEGLQLLPGIAGLPMCSLNIHWGVSPPKLAWAASSGNSHAFSPHLGSDPDGNPPRPPKRSGIRLGGRRKRRGQREGETAVTKQWSPSLPLSSGAPASRSSEQLWLSLARQRLAPALLTGVPFRSLASF